MHEWSFAREKWDECFAPVAQLGYELERVDAERYWKLHEEHMRVHFPPEVFFDVRALRTEQERVGQERIAEATKDSRLQDFCVGRVHDSPVLFFSGEQRTGSMYRMWHTNIDPEHRRKGVYTAILKANIAYTAALGFDTITSEHAPGNNAVLIAKLKAGFRIVGMDVDPLFGVSVVLKYFHNADHLATYQHRCGLATLNERIAKSGFGAFAQLREQLTSGD